MHAKTEIANQKKKQKEILNKLFPHNLVVKHLQFTLNGKAEEKILL